MFFFVAGYFFLSSFQSKGMWRFITAKFTRLVIPSMLVLLLLNPVHRYIHHYTRGFTDGVPAMGYLEYRTVLRGKLGKWFMQGNNNAFEFSLLYLWFVNLLFVFLLVFSPWQLP